MRARRWPSVWVSLAFLYAGLTNAHAHVHLCFDGKEDPVAVHVVDGAEHSHSHEHPQSDGDHDDVDLDVQNQALAKSFKHDLNALVPSYGHALPESRAIESIRAPPRCAAPAPSPPFLRPPLRAPPLR